MRHGGELFYCVLHVPKTGKITDLRHDLQGDLSTLITMVKSRIIAPHCHGDNHFVHGHPPCNATESLETYARFLSDRATKQIANTIIAHAHPKKQKTNPPSSKKKTKRQKKASNTKSPSTNKSLSSNAMKPPFDTQLRETPQAPFFCNFSANKLDRVSLK